MQIGRRIGNLEDRIIEMIKTEEQEEKALKKVWSDGVEVLQIKPLLRILISHSGVPEIEFHLDFQSVFLLMHTPRGSRWWLRCLGPC